MPPTPEEHVSTRREFLESNTAGVPISDGERIVISGISGLYPQANNVKELSEILYKKENPVTSQDSRWDYKHPELSDYTGKAPGVDRFDAQFFTVYYRLGHYMDPMSRKMLEHTYQAIYDAGLSPSHLNGKKVGVYIGSSFSDTEKKGFFDSVSRLGLGIVGSSKTMFANRISYWLNIKGPSLSIDEDDCSSTVALEQAYMALKRGECEAAIVGGAQLILHPQPLIHHGRLGAMSKDGITKSFAGNADGYSLSDSISVFILQKSKDALRTYAELVHVKNKFISVISDNTGPKYGHTRNPQVVSEFIKEFYNETEVTPEAVEYVEGYGTAVSDADKSELEAIEKVYCKNRVQPLLVGSVTSNIGLTGSAAGMSGITKVLLGYRNSELAANLNYEHPRNDIESLREGRMHILTEHQRFGRTYTAVNGMSVTGVNSHVLLHGHYKPKDLSRYKSSIPRLIVLSGRQESSVQKIFDDLKSRPVDAEELALLNNIHSRNISGHLGRGYIILDSNVDNKTLNLCEKAEYFDDAKHPLWFVYSGMGSQWAGMGAQFMQIPIFASAIEHCHQVLKPRGLDIVNIITSCDSKIFDNILYSFVGIAAIQIGLTDILKELGLEPDGIIGHSVGELGCAYADGCLTAEEMILAAYSRGLVSLQTPLIRGSMAAVGLGYDQISAMCPPEIDVACRNSSQSSTISGPADIMRDFVAELTSKQIFAKEVECSNIAYHSRYIADAGPNLLKYLKEVIKDPKPRNKRWISTSVPQDKWDEPSAKYCSAEYHTNNLLSPVLFEATMKLIPSNAVLVEVAPHGLLQAILKRALPASCVHVPLTRRGHPNNVLLLLQALGDIYMSGYTLNLQNLYPKVQFPVSTETPMLSHLVEWIHSETWSVTSFRLGNKINASSCKFVKSIHDDEHSYLRGHVIREKMCYPFAAALVAVWDTFAMYSGHTKREVSVQFHDLHLYAQPLLLDQQALKLNVAVNQGSGLFEVTRGYSRVMTGYVAKLPKKLLKLNNKENDTNFDNMALTSEDIYQLLNDREYNYIGAFRSIECANASFDEAALIWQNNWVTFIDGLLQLNMLRQSHHAISQPTNIRAICIDVTEHLTSHIYNLNTKNVLKAFISDVKDSTRCGGVEIHNIKFRNNPPVSHDLQLDLLVPPSELSNVNRKNTQQNDKEKIESLQCAEIGKLDSLHWVECPNLGQSNLIVKVHYAGLNMIDVKRAVGITSFDSNSFGMDYSGTTTSGERVMGIVKYGAASTYVCAQPELLWPVPKHWSLEDAATVPYAYAHAIYALRIKGHLEPGMRILVHGGVGALGQAVVAVALAYKCQVFTTVSSVSKKQFLRKLFPQIKEEHIGNSRDASFSDRVLVATQGKGCNIAINCLKGEFKNLSLKCCGLNGVLIDTVQIHDRENFKFGMFSMFKQRSYLAIDFSSVFTQGNDRELKALQKMLTEGIAAGYVVPLSRVSYEQHEVTRAFRLLGASKHRGRVLLRMCNSAIQVEHRLICDPDKCEVMFWDNDAIGCSIANLLVERGARKLYICCKNITTYLRLKMRTWQQLGVEVVVSVEDLNNNNLQNDSWKDAMSLGAFEGIYAIITKAIERNATNKLTSILNNLDLKSRSLCPQLRYFVVLSNVKNLGQQICSSRAESGFSATYLDLHSINEELFAGTDVAKITERAVCSPYAILHTRKKSIQPPTILEQIETLADISIPQNKGDKHVTLKELGMADEKVQLIGSVLNEVYNISLDEGIIPHLTIDKINDLQKSVTEIKPCNVMGLDTFFSNTGSDELLASTDIVVLPTLFRRVISIYNDLDIDERYLCIVPGMEGHHERFRVMCERLKLPAVVLQPGLDHPYETVRETAQRYSEILMKKTIVQDKFYILGYESGVAVAFELAAIFEKRGMTGTVFCIGFTPEQLRAELGEQLTDLGTKDQLQNAVVLQLFKLTMNEDSAALDKALHHATTWEEKKDAFVRCTLGRMAHSAQYVRAFLESMLARIDQVRGYNTETSYCLRSQIVLLRAASTSKPLPSTLTRLSQRPVIVHQLSSILSSVLNDMQCPSLINRYLDADTLTVFDKQNLCDSYQINTSAKST